MKWQAPAFVETVLALEVKGYVNAEPRPSIDPAPSAVPEAR
jgi:hypothetical protein